MMRGSQRRPFWTADFSEVRLHFEQRRLNCGVEEFFDIQCPYCGQTCELVIDTSFARQRFTTDCQVCCRPFEVTAECEAGEIVSVEAAVD